MLKDITLGQYYPSGSVIHKLDPRVKLLGTLLFIISLFAFSGISAYIVASIFLFAVIQVTRVPVKYMIKGLKAIIVLILITVVFNLFLTQGEPLVHFWRFTITYQGLRISIYMVIRLIYLVLGSSVMTLTTTPTSLTDGLEKGLGFLKRFHVPVHEVAMMMSIALRFIPILMDETDKIEKAQMARGAAFDSGKLMERIKSFIPILVPLFVSAFRRANDLAMAMEARGYHGGEGRTKMHPLEYQKRDYIAFILLAAYMAAMFCASHFLRINKFF